MLTLSPRHLSVDWCSLAISDPDSESFAQSFSALSRENELAIPTPSKPDVGSERPPLGLSFEDSSDLIVSQSGTQPWFSLLVTQRSDIVAQHQ